MRFSNTKSIYLMIKIVGVLACFYFGGTAHALEMQGGMPPCDAPNTSDFQAKNITQSTVTLKCDLNAFSYEFRWRLNGTTTWTTVSANQNGRASVSMLVPDTEYDYQCRVLCTTVWSGWSVFETFQTEPCHVPTLSQFNIADVSFTKARAYTTLNNYDQIRFQVVTSHGDIVQTMKTSGSEVFFDGLPQGHSLIIKCRTKCHDVWGDWSDGHDFQTGLCQEPGQLRVAESTIENLRVICNQGAAKQLSWNVIADGANFGSTILRQGPSLGIPGFIPGQNYEVKVKAQCESTDDVVWSNYTQTLHVGAKCDNIPLSLLSFGELTATSVNLRCDVSGGVEYEFRIIRGASGARTRATVSQDYTFHNLEPESNYTFKVRMTCVNGQTEWAEGGTFITQDICDAPVASEFDTTQVGETNAQVECTIAGKNSYEFQYRISDEINWITSLGSGQSNQFTGLFADVTYEYRCRYACSNGFSPWSNNKKFKTDRRACRPPQTGLRGGEFEVTDIKGSEAYLECHIPNQQQYVFQYKIIDFDFVDGWTEVATNSSRIKIDDLHADTWYMARMSLLCDNALTDWSDFIYFTTGLPLQPCRKVQEYEFATGNIGANIAELFAFIPTKVEFQFRRLGDSNWHFAEGDIYSPIHTAGDLQSGTTYEYRVRYVCENRPSRSKYSNWSEPKTFETIIDHNNECDELSPSSLSVNQIGQSTVTVSVNVVVATNQSNPSTIHYQLRYRAVTENAWIDLSETTGKEWMISPLLRDTEYEVQVRKRCDQVHTKWSDSVFFRTLANGSYCEAPSDKDLIATDISEHSAILNNIAPILKSNTQLFGFRYRLSGSSAWLQTPDETEVQQMIVGLASGSQYEFQGRLICGEDATDWSVFKYFITEGESMACSAPDFNEFDTVSVATDAAHLINKIAGYQSYGFRWKLTSALIWNEEEQIESELEILDLVPNSDYEYQVRVFCGDLFSDWSESKYFSTAVSSMTECSGPSIDDFQAQEIEAERAILTTNLNDSVDIYFQYRVHNQLDWIMLDPLQGRNLALSKLLPSTQYEYRMSRDCEGEMSDWSDVKSFTTLDDSEDVACDTLLDEDFAAVFVTMTTASLENYLLSSAYDFRYREKDSIEWIDLAENASNSREIEGLRPGTQYIFQSRYHCVEVFSEWSFDKCFTTKTWEAPCDGLSIEGLASRDTLETGQILSCSHSYVRQHQFRYRCVGGLDTTWTTLPLTRDVSVLLENLEIGKRYEFQCRGICAEGEIGSWTGSAFFQIEGETTAFKEVNQLDFQLYPNPAKKQLHLDLPNENMDFSYQILDLRGVTILQGQVSRSRTIDLNLFPGFYVVTIRSDTHRGSHKFIVRD